MPQDGRADELNVGVLLFIPYRAMENRVFTALADAGFSDITLAQARLMQRIGPDGSRLTALAEQAQVTKQTAGFLIDQLERAAYVERAPDPTDGRARIVRMSERGQRATKLANEVVANVEQEWTAHLGEQRMRQLRGHLGRLRTITDPYQ